MRRQPPAARPRRAACGRLYRERPAGMPDGRMWRLVCGASGAGGLGREVQQLVALGLLDRPRAVSPVDLEDQALEDVLEDDGPLSMRFFYPTAFRGDERVDRPIAPSERRPGRWAAPIATFGQH